MHSRDVIFMNLKHSGPKGKSKIELTWLKYGEIQEPRTLFVNYSYNSFYEFCSSENTYKDQKIMCQNMGFSVLDRGYIWT